MIEDRLELTDALFDLSKVMLQATKLQDVKDILKLQLNKIFKAKHWNFFLQPVSGNDLLCIASANEKCIGHKISEQGIVGWVAKEQKAAVVNSAYHDSRFDPWYDKLVSHKTTTIVALPLRTEKRLWGVLELIDLRKEQALEFFELNILAGMVECLALTIERCSTLQALQKNTLLDGLTGLYNRMGFEKLVNQEIVRCQRYKQNLSLLLLEIDDFQKLSLDRGYIYTNGLLLRITATLKKKVRKADIAACFGNIFALILPSTDKEQAAKLQLRMLSELQSQYLNDNISLYMIVHTMEANSAQDILSLAERKLYLQKKTGISPLTDFNKDKREKKSEKNDRSFYRKKVNLAGQFIIVKNGERCDMVVEDLSMQGIGFSTVGFCSLAIDDVLDLIFKLDNTQKTEINKKVVVRSVNKNFIGTEIYDKKAYDGDLGFYLMA